MPNIGKIFSGIGILIAIYLFISNGRQTVDIINAIATNTVDGITTLQGRSAK